LSAAETVALASIAPAFARTRDARTPIERLRRMAYEWLALAVAEPYLVHLVIHGDGRPRGAHVRLREMIRSALESTAAAARAAGVVGRPVDAARLRGVVGAFVAFADGVIEDRSRPDPPDLSGELVDFSLRAFR